MLAEGQQACQLWCVGHDLVLQRDGATRAHIALYSTGRPIRGQFKKTLCGCVHHLTLILTLLVFAQ